jgi:hypothetical protein
MLASANLPNFQAFSDFSDFSPTAANRAADANV